MLARLALASLLLCAAVTAAPAASAQSLPLPQLLLLNMRLTGPDGSDVTNGAHDFGSVAMYDTAAYTVTLTNVAAAGGPQVQYTATVSGPGAATLTLDVNASTCQVAQLPSSPNTLDSGSSCSIVVNFAPVALGTQQASLTVTDQNGIGTPSVTLQLQGTGTSPTHSPLAISNPGPIQLSAALHAVAIGDVTIRNTAHVAIRITSIDGSAPDPNSASALRLDAPGALGDCVPTGMLLDPGEPCFLHITFSPQQGSPGDQSQFDAHINYDGFGSPIVLHVVGTIAAPPPPPRLTFSSNTNTVSFGGVRVNEQLVSAQVTITNTEPAGGHNIWFRPDLSGLGASGFSVNQTTCSFVPADFEMIFTPLAPGQSCQLTFDFTPGADQEYQATYRLYDLNWIDANTAFYVLPPVAPSVTIGLDGTGVGTPLPAVTLSPDPVDFGNVAIGRFCCSSPRKVVHVTNVLNHPITIVGPGLAGSLARSGPFSLTPNDNGGFCNDNVPLGGRGTRLDPGQGCDVAVSFVSAVLPDGATGPLQTTLDVSTDQAGSPQVVNVQANAALGAAQFSPAQADFGTLRFQAGPPLETVTLTNVGQAAVDFGCGGCSGLPGGSNTVSAPFGFDPSDPGTCSALYFLDAGASCTLRLTVSTASLGEQTGTVAVDFGQFSHIPAQNRTLSLHATIAQPVVSLSTTQLDLGSMPEGGTPTITQGRAAVDLTNTGGWPLTLRPSVSGADFSLDTGTNCGSTLAPSSTCEFLIDFSPVGTGHRSGQLRIDDDAPGSPHTVALTGFGLAAPLVHFDVPALDFGDVAVHSAGLDRTVTLTNPGGQTLSYTASVSGGAFGFANGGTCPRVGSLDPGLACTFVVHFQPTDGVPFFGGLVLDDNANNPTQVLELSGQGELPYTGCPSTGISYHFTALQTPYILTCSLQVNPGQSLTVEPGVEIRLPDAARIDVYGTATFNGTASAPIVVDSAVAPDAGRWQGVFLRGGSQANLQYTTIQSAGHDYGRAVWVMDGAAPTLSNLSVLQTAGTGVYYEGTAGGTLSSSNVNAATGPGVDLGGTGCPAVTNLAVSNAAEYGIKLSSLACDPDMTGLQLTHNGGADHIWLNGGELVHGKRTLRQRGYDYDLQGSIQVDAAAALVLEPNIVVRIQDAQHLDVYGQFDATSGGMQLISATGSDPGRWQGLFVRGGSKVQVSNAVIHSAGHDYSRAVWVFDGASPAFSNLSVVQSAGTGVYYEGSANGTLTASTIDTTTDRGVVLAGPGCPTITRTSITHAAGYGLQLSSIACDPDLTGLQLSQNGGEDRIWLNGGELHAGTKRILRQRGHAYDLQGSLQVDPDAALVFETNLIVRMQDAQHLDVYGILDATSGGLQLVSAVNADAGRWQGIFIRGGSRVLIKDASVQSAGHDYARAVWVMDGASPALSNLSVLQTAGTGVYYEGGAAGTLSGSTVDTTTGPGVVLGGAGCPSVTGLTVANAADYGIKLSSIACDPDLNGLSQVHNGGGNHIFLQGGELTGGLQRTLRQRGYIYDLQGSIQVDSGATLTFEPNLTLTIQDAQHLDVYGAMDATSGGLQLESAVGPEPGRWQGVFIRGGSSVQINRAHISAAGHDYGHAVWILDGASPALRQVNVGDTAGDAFHYDGSGAGTLADASVDVATGAGLNLNGNGCPNVTNLSVANTNDYGLRLHDLACDPSLSGLSLVNDGGANRIWLNGGELTLGQSRTLHFLGHEYDLQGSIQVDSGAVLQLDPGTTLRMQDAQHVDDYGTLNASGTGAAPISFVSAIAADPGRWQGVFLRAGSSATLDHVTIASAGHDFGHALWIFDGAQPTLDYINLLANSGSGLYSDASAPQLITHANFVGNTSFGVYNAGSAVLDARNNWWGSSTGPGNPLENDGGEGDSVSNNVLFIPWAGEKVLPPLTISVPPDVVAPTDHGLAIATVDAGMATSTSSTVQGTRSDNLALNAPYPFGITKITWQASDLYGQVASAIQTITVVDREAPLITAPADLTVTAAPGALRAALDIGQATATDNVPGVQVTETRSDGLSSTALFPIGSTSINWTATDTSGNTGIALQHIVVKLDPSTAITQLTPGQPGLIRLPSGSGRLVFPPDLTNTPSQVVLTELANIPHAVQQGRAFAGRAYALEVTQVSSGSALHQFGTTYTSTVSYSDAILQSAGIPSASTLRLASWNGTAWQNEPSQVDVANHLVIGSLNHASEWALIGDTTAPPAPCLDSDCGGGGGQPGPPGAGATPELDSLLLFTAGLTVLAAYAARRRRAGLAP